MSVFECNSKHLFFLARRVTEVLEGRADREKLLVGFSEAGLVGHEHQLKSGLGVAQFLEDTRHLEVLLEHLLAHARCFTLSCAAVGYWNESKTAVCFPRNDFVPQPQSFSLTTFKIFALLVLVPLSQLKTILVVEIGPVVLIDLTVALFDFLDNYFVTICFDVKDTDFRRLFGGVFPRRSLSVSSNGIPVDFTHQGVL